MTVTDYKEMNREAALRFLQTAVVVDDAATVNPPDGKGADLVSPGILEGIKAAREDAQPAAESDLQPGEAPRLTVNVKAIADALADREITCGVLRPTADEAADVVIDRVVRVSARVDLVVLDWILDQASELTSLEAVKRIVSEDHKGCRVIAIYTSQQSLDDIAAQLEDELQGIERNGEEMILRVGGTRIALFRKAGVDPGRSGEEGPVYDESELAEQLIEVFLDLAQGLVRGIALNTMAAIRENLHAVLSRLGPPLDLGYAGHLLRLDHLDEGVLQILDSIGGELRGVIEDDLRSHRAGDATALGAWIDHRREEGEIAIPRDMLARYLMTPPSERGEVRNEVINDLRKNHLVEAQGFTSKRFRHSATALFTSNYDVDTARKADGDFAILLALRHAYGSPPPYLRLGTIISDPDRTKYWLCMQPDCDSVRLKGTSVPFPLIPLELIDDDESGFHFVVPRGGSNVQLLNPATPAAIVKNSFRPDPETGTVRFRATNSEPRQFVVHTTHSKFFLWAGQLKSAHAARVAHGLGQHLSRIGLDESEWLQSRMPRVGSGD